MADDIYMFPVRRADLVVREIEGETLILDGQTGLVHQFNQSAGIIWLCCDGSLSVSDIANRLSVEYDLSATDVEQDVVDTIGKFQELGLLSSL
jgi:hypothetical protein